MDVGIHGVPEPIPRGTEGLLYQVRSATGGKYSLLWGKGDL